MRSLHRWVSLLLLALGACSDDAGSGAGGDAGTGGAGASASGGGGSTASTTAIATGSGGEGGAGGSIPMGPPCVANGYDGVCVETSDCVLPGWAPIPGFCDGPAEVQCCVELPEGTCDPSAHPLPNAGLVEAPGLGGCPDGMTRVDSFCVDVYEASLVTYPDGAPVSPYFNPEGALVMAVSVAGAVPQGYIDQLQASEACLASGKRLCTNEEWLRACQGPDTTTYPYGDDLALGVCNDHRAEHPAIEYFMTTDDWIWFELGHPCLNQLADGLDATGLNAGCATTEGAFDMMGNLHEWTDDPSGTFRGGFYVDTMLNGPGCLYATTAHDVSHWDYSTGFRCCADPLGGTAAPTDEP